MARDTRAGAKQEIYDLLAPGNVPALDGIGHAYRCDPGPGRTGYPTFLIVASTGMLAHAFLVAVRVGVDANIDSEAAQDALDDLSTEVDLLLTPVFAPGSWEDDYDQDLEAWVSTSVYEVSREDGLLRFDAPGASGGLE